MCHQAATLSGEAGSTSKANTVGYEDALAEGEGSAQVIALWVYCNGSIIPHADLHRVPLKMYPGAAKSMRGYVIPTKAKSLL